MQAASPTDTTRLDFGWKIGQSDRLALAWIALFVLAIFLPRLTTQPLAGEETRWATGAREMLITGDWIVPRQQGHIFPERPPMTMWAMAAIGHVRGDVDVIAIRLPSVIAVLLTSIVVYVYARKLLSPTAAIVAALAYPTMGQVLQLGRLGESEALFTLLVAASLLVWHLGYMRQWPSLATWCLGFGFAGLGALVKGPQAPVYFIAITSLYLLLRRDWRFAWRWQFVCGALAFLAIVGAWQVPFYLATDWAAVKATWSGLAADRIHLSGLLRHVVTYPLETLACLLPWSPLLVVLFKREARELLDDRRDVVVFLLTALAVAYPTVWLATGARGRYFMPLYPLVAILVGFIVSRLPGVEAGRYPRRAWHQFQLLAGVSMAVGGIVVLSASLIPAFGRSLHQPVVFAIAFCAAALIGSAIVLHQYRSPGGRSSLITSATIAGLVGFAYTGAIVNVNAARWNDPTQAVAEIKGLLPPSATLVSLSPIEHRFAYYYNDQIPELDWPARPNDLQRGIEYFCFMRNPGDTAERRAAGRGRTWTTTPGTLPFAWEELASINVERSPRDKRTVVLGRVIRPLRAEITDVTRPRLATAKRTAGDNATHQRQ